MEVFADRAINSIVLHEANKGQIIYQVLVNDKFQVGRVLAFSTCDFLELAIRFLHRPFHCRLRRFATDG